MWKKKVPIFLPIHHSQEEFEEIINTVYCLEIIVFFLEKMANFCDFPVQNS